MNWVYKKNIEAHIRSIYNEMINVILDLESVGIPESISDNYSASYGEVNALGRSSPMIDYANGGPREVSFSLMIREDRTPRGMDIIDVVNSFKSIAYPQYEQQDFVEPPVILFVLGDVINLRGVCTSVEVSWEGPYGETSKNRNSYYNAEVSLSFQEVPLKVKSASDILSNG